MPKFIRNFKAFENAAKEEAQLALEQTADAVVKTAQSLAPVDTGALRRSYRFEKVSPDHIIVGSHSSEINPKTNQPVEYATYVEFGTTNNIGQPHFVPAFQQSRALFELLLKRAMQKAAALK